MADFHHNIFYYYSGTKLNDSDREQQLENNTTKALINTLKHSRPEVACEFLSWLGIETNSRPTFELQRKNIATGNIRSKSRRLLLGITQIKDGKTPHIDEAEVNSKGLPDAWIYGEDFVVLIESKVGFNRLNKDQMDVHGRKLGKGKYETRHITWKDIFQFLKGLCTHLALTDKDKWLINQFTEYLEWNNMAEFTGFKNELFEYFVTRDDTNKKWVSSTIKAFADKIMTELQKTELQQLDSFYQDYDIGNLKIEDEGYWVGFGPTQPRKDEYRRWAHQSIAVSVKGLEIFVNVELKHAMLLLRKRLETQEKKFRQLITEIPDTITIQIEESKPILKRPRKFNYYTLAKIEGGLLKDPLLDPYGIKDMRSEGFDYMEYLLKQAERPCLSVRRLLSRKKLIEFGDGQALVTEVIQIMQAFHPLVAFINNDEQEYTKYQEQKSAKADRSSPG